MKIFASIRNKKDQQTYIIPVNIYDDNSWIKVSTFGNRVEVKKYYDKLELDFNDWNIIYQNIPEVFICKLLDADFRNELIKKDLS